MQIAGIQKLSLIDYPKKLSCTLFLYKCNFRCNFCHNPELVTKENNINYSEEDILEFLKKRKKYLDGVCITGGEPLISLDLNFLKKIKELGYLIKLDTNGSFPKKLSEVFPLVDFVAMDIKASKKNYEKIANCKVNLKNIEESIKLISRLKNYEFRTTIIEDLHSIKEIKNIAIWLNEILGKKPKKFCLQAFKKQDKLLDKEFYKKKNTSKEYLLKLKEEIESYFEEVKVRG